VRTPEARTERKRQATAISNGIGAIHCEHCGRGADRIRTMIHEEVVMTTLEECFTTVEKKMIAEGPSPRFARRGLCSRTGCAPASPRSSKRPTGVELFILSPSDDASTDGGGPG
jgi:Na+-translocating membrane potential-generating system (MpsC)